MLGGGLAAVKGEELDIDRGGGAGAMGDEEEEEGEEEVGEVEEHRRSKEIWNK